MAAVSIKVFVNVQHGTGIGRAGERGKFRTRDALIFSKGNFVLVRQRPKARFVGQFAERVGVKIAAEQEKGIRILCVRLGFCPVVSTV